MSKTSKKETNLNLFIKEMNEMLEVHEKISNDFHTLNIAEEEGKIDKSQYHSKQNSNTISQKTSTKNTMINSTNLSYKVLPNPNSSTISQSTQKIQPKGTLSQSNTSTPSLSKINYTFNKNNVTNSANIFKTKNIN